MSRVSQAIKSLIYGVSTDNKRLRDKLYLAEQTNMQTVEGSGLHKRPPAELIAAGTLTNYVNDGTHHSIIKSFLIGSETYYFTLKSLVANPLATKTVVIYDSQGVAQASVIDTIGYYAGITAKTDIEIRTQQDTVFVLNKTLPTAMTTATRSTNKISLIHVKEAPGDGTTMTISFVDAAATTHTVLVTAGSALSTRGTNVIAANIRAAINNTGAAGVTADSRGSVVSIRRTDSAYAAVAVEDQASGNVLVAINGSISTVLDVPKYCDSSQILTVQPVENSTAGTFYLQSNEITTASVPTAPVENCTINAGRYDDLSGTNIQTGYQAAPYTPVLGTITPTGAQLNGVTIGTIAFVKNRDGTGIHDFSIYGASSAPFPSGSLSRCTVVDTVTAAIIFDGNVTPLAVAGGEWYQTVITSPVELVTGRNYKVYFDKTFALTTNLKAVDWTETSAPNQKYLLDPTTMPQTLTLASPGNIHIANTAWDERNAGDNDTNPQPAFIGNPINNLAIFQNRLVAVQDDIVETTETDNTRSWFRNTVTQLLDTHPVRVRSTSEDSAEFHSTLNHNRDLLLFSNKSQFKLPGNQPLTPSTAGIPQTTSYINNPECTPINVGKNVFFSFNYGAYGGISKYKANDADTQDRADPITDHVKKFMRGTPTQLLGDANLGILYVIQGSELYVCDFNPREALRSQDNRWAWSKWHSFQGDTTIDIADACLIGNKLQLVLTSGETQADIVALNIVQDPDAAEREVYLDYKVDAVATAGSFTVPATYPITDPNFRVVYATGEALEGAQAEFTITGNTVTLTSEFEATTNVTYGIPYEVAFQPSTIYVRDENGQVNTFTHVSILQWLLYMTDSADVSASIISNFVSPADQYWSGLIVRDFSTTTDSVANNEGTFTIGYKQQSELASLRIHSTGHLPLNVTQLEWLGNYVSRGKRF